MGSSWKVRILRQYNRSTDQMEYFMAEVMYNGRTPVEPRSLVIGGSSIKEIEAVVKKVVTAMRADVLDAETLTPLQ